MGCEPDQWAKNWLEDQWIQGKNGLTAEKRGDTYIVKVATMKWDPDTKKRKIISEYGWGCSIRRDLGSVEDLFDSAKNVLSSDMTYMLDVYATMNNVMGDTEVRQLVSKEVRNLDVKLEIFLYNTHDNRDRLTDIKKKRDGKPKASRFSS